MPHAGAAGPRAEMGGMDGDDRFEARLRVGYEMDELMLVEIGKIPKASPLSSCPKMFYSQDNGATNGT
jgi:hypothetical protein